MSKLVFIGLGSNLNDPIVQLNAALAAMQTMRQTQLIKHSDLFWSHSLLVGQPRYCNAVAKLTTGLTATELLTALQAIENRQGRIRSEKWAARIIDLDILLYDDEIINTENLTIPHVELIKRNFWLYPLFELAPHLFLPVANQPLARLMENVDLTDLERITS